MYVCEKCGWLYSGSHCPRCGMVVRTDDDLSDVTLSGPNAVAHYGTREEREAKAREFLWDSVHTPSPNPDECIALADKLRSYAPYDYYANFVGVVFSGGEDMIGRFLSQPITKDAEMYAEPVLDYMCSHMSTELYPAVRRYLERTNLAHPEKYETLIESYLPDNMKMERNETEEKKKREEVELATEAVRAVAEEIVKKIAEREVREAAENIIKEIAEREVHEAVSRAETEFREALERLESEENGKIETAVRVAAERIVKEVVERELREINERKERERLEAEERERKEKEEHINAEAENKRREQHETAERIEKERQETEVLKRKREEDKAFPPYRRGDEFKFEKKGVGYVLTRMWDCENSVVSIPPVYNGLPVTGIGNKAFAGCCEIKSVIVPYGVTFVGDEAFENNISLESVHFPKSLESIGGSAFKGCMALKNVDISAVTSIGKWAFSECWALSKLTLPEGLDSIQDGVFSNCSSSLNNGIFNIPIGVKNIGTYAFYGSYLSKVYIPLSVKSIGEHAFSWETILYYFGTERSWNKIVRNKDFGGKTVFFYSASQPCNKGHFWHCDENGDAVEW